MKEILEKLLEINLEINSLLKQEDNEQVIDLAELLSIKDKFIQELISLKEQDEKEFIRLKTTDYKEIWQKLQALDKENIQLLIDKKDKMSGKIHGIKTHMKTISKYKFKTDQEPRLFDESL